MPIQRKPVLMYGFKFYMLRNYLIKIHHKLASAYEYAYVTGNVKDQEFIHHLFALQMSTPIRRDHETSALCMLGH